MVTQRESNTESTYLLTWNPDLFPIDRVEGIVEEIQTSGSAIFGWGIGKRRHVNNGDRVFLFRQGAEPRGIVGLGRIQGDEVVQIPHFVEEEREQGKKVWIASVRWESLSITPIISRTELIQRVGEEKLWNAQASGVEIDPDLAKTLEQLWLQASAETFRFAQALSDIDDKNDFIGISQDVVALSTLLAVNRIEPPLSIAIFGEWGSGKTFLIRKIRERVAALEVANKTRKNEAEADRMQMRYCRSILQIEFNAWHFTESNLWASLVNHIFEKLQRHLELAPGEEDVEEPIRLQEKKGGLKSFLRHSRLLARPERRQTGRRKSYRQKLNRPRPRSEKRMRICGGPIKN